MHVEWFCQVMGSEVGPLTQAQLVDMVRHHKITPEDLVKRNDSPWVAAFEVKGLFAAAAKPAPAPKSAPADDSSQEQAPPESKAVKEKTSPPKEKVAAAPVGSARSDRPSTAAAKPSSGEADWFCIASGEKQGPLGFDELQKLAADGRLRQTDRVWRSSSPKFCKAADIDGLGT